MRSPGNGHKNEDGPGIAPCGPTGDDPNPPSLYTRMRFERHLAVTSSYIIVLVRLTASLLAGYPEKEGRTDTPAPHRERPTQPSPDRKAQADARRSDLYCRGRLFVPVRAISGQGINEVSTHCYAETYRHAWRPARDDVVREGCRSRPSEAEHRPHGRVDPVLGPQGLPDQIHFGFVDASRDIDTLLEAVRRIRAGGVDHPPAAGVRSPGTIVPTARG